MVQQRNYVAAVNSHEHGVLFTNHFFSLPSMPNWWSPTAYECFSAGRQSCLVESRHRSALLNLHLPKKQVTLACLNPREVSKSLRCLLVVLYFLICCHLGPGPAPGGQKPLHLSARWSSCCWVAEGRVALSVFLRWNCTLQLMFSTLCTWYRLPQTYKVVIMLTITVNYYCCLKGKWEEKNTSKGSRWHLE